MMTDALIKAGRPDTSCARACYVGRYYSSTFVVAYPTVLGAQAPTFRRKLPSSVFKRECYYPEDGGCTSLRNPAICTIIWRHIPEAMFL